MRLALAAILLAAPAAAQDATPDPATDDCAFLQQSFRGVYDGLRMMSGDDIEQASPELVTMFTVIQSNIILLADAADCDMDPMIEVAREQLGRYAPEAP